jgi:hypothetical protein
LTIREEHGLRVFENRVLREMSGTKGGEAAGGYRELRNKLQILHYLSNTVRIIK